MKIGVIGTGNIGGTVARKLSGAGHDVRVANSRGMEGVRAFANEIGATAVDTRGAVKGVGLIVISIPFPAVAELPKDLFDTVPQDVPVIDTGNYYPQRDGNLSELDTGALTSSGLLQRYLPDAHVVKVFNNIFFKHLRWLARPHGAEDRSALPIAGDSEPAKAAVTAFLDSIGYDAVDAGSLADSWRQEPGTPVYGTPYGPFSDEVGTPAGAARIHADLVGAHR